MPKQIGFPKDSIFIRLDREKKGRGLDEDLRQPSALPIFRLASMMIGFWGNFLFVIWLLFGKDMVRIELMTILIGGNTGFFAELFNKQGGVGKSAEVADLCDGLLGGGNQFFGVFQALGQNVLFGGEA